METGNGPALAILDRVDHTQQSRDHGRIVLDEVDDLFELWPLGLIHQSHRFKQGLRQWGELYR